MLVDKWWQLALSAAACGHATASVHGKGDFRILEVLALLMAVACCQTIAIELPW
jgi:hypothetical protein